MTDGDPPPRALRRRLEWLPPGARAIGVASFFSDLGHEVPTSLLPSFLTSTLGAPASALGLIEGFADAASGVAKLAGGALADEPRRRRGVAIGGYLTTAALSSGIGAATSAVQVGLLRAGAWSARGIRSPARNAILADLVEPDVYGRAYGYERALDNLGAILGPLLAALLVGIVGVRGAMFASIVPGILAAISIAYAARHVRVEQRREHRRLRLQVRPVLRGRLGRLFVGMGAFEFGNVAATLLILRATELLTPTVGADDAARTALLLYVGYNVAATLASVPGGHVSDRRSSLLALTIGTSAFLASYLLLAGGSTSVPLLLGAFVLAGVGIGFVETAEAAAVAAETDEAVRGSAFGLLAGLQSLGNLAASGVAGFVWTLASPRAAFLVCAGWMAVALVAFATSRGATATGAGLAPPTRR